MQDDNPHIVVECIKCHFRYDVLFGLSCPRCRTLAVQKAFSPLDSLRTALGIYGKEGVNEMLNPFQKNSFRPSHTCIDHPNLPCDACEFTDTFSEALAKRGVRRHGEEYYRPSLMREFEPETPRDCKVPLGEANQIYQLKRLFRL